MGRKRMLARRAAGDGTLIMIGGTLGSGVLTYAWQAAGTRTLGEVAFAPVASVWTIMFLVITVLLAPVEQYSIRTVAAGEHGRSDLARALPRLWRLAAAASVVMLIGAWLLREPLFDGDSSYALLCGTLVTTFLLLALVRGTVAGRRRFADYGYVTILVEVLRLAVGLPILAAGGSAFVFALTIPIAPLAALLWMRRVPRHATMPPSVDAIPVQRFIAHTVGGTVAAQIVLASGPLVLAVLGAPAAAVTSLFVTQTAFRAAFMVATPGCSRALPALTRIASRQEYRRLRRHALQLLVMTPVAAAIGGIAAGVVTPPVVATFFGEGTRPTAYVAGMCGAGTVFAVGNLALTQILVAGVETRRIALVWWLALAAGAIAVVLIPGDPSDRVITAFVIAEAVALGGLTLAASIGFNRRELALGASVTIGATAVAEEVGAVAASRR